MFYQLKSGRSLISCIFNLGSLSCYQETRKCKFYSPKKDFPVTEIADYYKVQTPKRFAVSVQEIKKLTHIPVQIFCSI